MFSLYINIDIDEGFIIVEEELEKINYSRLLFKILLCFFEKVFKFNNFIFNGENYI